MESVLQKRKECLLCKTTMNLHRHHCFEGSNRRASEEYGLTVYLCARHHNMSNDSVHLNSEMGRELKRWAQRKAMEHYNWTEDDFRKHFRKSWL